MVKDLVNVKLNSTSNIVYTWLCVKQADNEMKSLHGTIRSLCIYIHLP